MLQEAKTMKIEFTWDEPTVPEYDPDKHNPELSLIHI